ncbi:Crp/Fnr family transcriptional regulator [Schlesneria paludicola]|uniref:Crp/Fnr family transcriptional regulator n=1 Tax=Schlesneria paludicola TaxID=360056 RepID=UPI00029A84C0|nr:cyclic nucleotide-binding domain-containing protein [Schlesneria paludicola]
MNEDILQNLQKVNLFRGLSAEEVRSMMSHAELRTYGSSASVFETGADERAIYFLVEGTVEIALEVPFSTEVILDELNVGSVFGESSFFHSQPHSVTARAVSEVTVARLERADYDRLLESNNLAACRMGANAAEILAAKLQHTDHWIADLLQAEEAHRTRERWHQFRQSLGHAFDNPEGGGFSTHAGWRE